MPRLVFICICSLLLFISSAAVAQLPNNITGSWYGTANADIKGTYDNYLTELIIRQQGSNVSGVFGYYFRNGFESIYISGRYIGKDRILFIKTIPITYFRALDIDGVDCIMDLTGVLVSSKVKSTLDGTLTPVDKYKYTCPELKFHFTLDPSEGVTNNDIVKNGLTRKIWQPLPGDVVVAGKNIDQANSPASPVSAADNKLVEEMERRKNIYSNDIYVTSDSIRVSFYDNGEVDGDSINVFFNNHPVLTNQELSTKAVNIYIKLDDTKEVNELTMFAINLGKYPPNTALMVITDENFRQEVFLSSSLTQNATIRIRKKK